MIAAFRVRESFSHEDYELLRLNCERFAESFPAGSCEFFYYLKPAEPDRWFFIRAGAPDRERFVETAQVFAEEMGFEIITRGETKPLLARVNLDAFV